MSKVVTKKILPKYFIEVQAGRKNFELRKDEDDIQAGDILVLNEFNPANGNSTGRSIKRRVTYVLRNVPGYGLQEGYCIIGF